MNNDGWQTLNGLNQRFGAHMGKYERKVWEQYCKEIEEVPKQIYYDVLIGNKEVNWVDSRNNRMHHRDPWSNWRIDAVMVFRDRIVLVEVKHRANLQGLGQVISYPILFSKTYQVDLPVCPLLVAAQIPLPLVEVFNTLEIDYYQVHLKHYNAKSSQIEELDFARRIDGQADPDAADQPDPEKD